MRTPPPLWEQVYDEILTTREVILTLPKENDGPFCVPSPPAQPLPDL